MPGTRGKARITLPMQAHIVRMIAENYAYPDIAADVNRRFGSRISRYQIMRCHPKHNRVPKKISDIFHDAQKKFLEKTADDFPISKLVYRLSRLQKMEQQCIEADDMAMHLKVLKQAFLEMSNLNRRIELTGIDGSPIRIQHEFRKMTDKELDSEIQAMVDAANNVIDITPPKKN